MMIGSHMNRNHEKYECPASSAASMLHCEAPAADSTVPEETLAAHALREPALQMTAVWGG